MRIAYVGLGLLCAAVVIFVLASRAGTDRLTGLANRARADRLTGLANRARADRLTGLANRARAREASNRALVRGARTGRYTAALMLDLNGLTQVNDVLGRRSGDLVLIEFARLLRRCLPPSGLPARLGGDAFAVVLPELGSPGEAYEIAGQIAAATAPVMIEGRLVTLACSIGVAASGPGELTHDELARRADLAMSRAKKLGPATRWAAFEQLPSAV